MFYKKITQQKGGILTYGLTPPKLHNSPEKLKEIAHNQINRLKKMPIDALVLYDIQDESARTSQARPFPFLPTLDPLTYSQNYLQEVKIPKIIYQCVGKYTDNQLISHIAKDGTDKNAFVLVGAAAKEQSVSLKLPEAYRLFNAHKPKNLLGGVTIPERHLIKGNEHIKLVEKTAQGCQFFISQAVYHLEAAKNLLSDYYYYCRANHLEIRPILFTLTPCGSLKTLAFMKWLGIHIPKWLENDLTHAQDILDKSILSCNQIAMDLWQYAKDKKIPIGFNIESVSINKAEIEASVVLITLMKALMG